MVVAPALVAVVATRGLATSKAPIFMGQAPGIDPTKAPLAYHKEIGLKDQEEQRHSRSNLRVSRIMGHWRSKEYPKERK